MKNLLVVTQSAVSTAASPEQVAGGTLAAFYYKNGVFTNLGSDSPTGLDEMFLVLGSGDANVSPEIVRVNASGFSTNTMEYADDVVYTSSTSISAPVSLGEFGMVIVKKGVNFNERSNFTYTHYVDDLSIGSAGLVDEFVKQINDNLSNGLTAVNTGGKLVITANEKGVDYSVSFFGLTKATVDSETSGKKGVGTFEFVSDLYREGVADKGVNYTYDGNDLNPNYPFGTEVSAALKAMKFDIANIKTYGNLVNRPVDAPIKEIIQVAYPTGSTAVAGLFTKMTAAFK